MPLTEIALLDSYLTPFYGRELYFGLEGFNNLDIYSLISNDLNPYYNPPTIGGYFVEWNILVNVLSYNDKVVQTYGGNPTRFKFGAYNFCNADMNYQHEFIYYERQYSSYGRTFVVPGDIPTTLIFPPALAPLTGSRLRGLSDFISVRSIPTATSINIDLQPSVIADVYLVYGGLAYDTQTFDYYTQTVFVNI